MQRKIIRQGHNTLTITLPSVWANNLHLKPGSEVNVIERDNGLLVTASKLAEEKKTSFDVSSMDTPTIWKHFMAVYREGYSEVKVTFPRGEQIENPYKFFTNYKLNKMYRTPVAKMPILEALQLFVNRFIGFEIIEHGKDYIIIREMGELTNKEFDNSLRRVFLLVQQMVDETHEALTNNNPSALSHMPDVDINVDKFQDYCIRILHRIGGKAQRKTSVYFAVLYFLELIGDEYKNLSYHLIYDPKSNKKFDKYIAVAAEYVKQQFDAFYELFYTFDQAKIDIISKIDREVYLNANKMYRSMNDYDKEVFHHLRMIEKYINSLLELRIEMHM